MRPLQSFGRVQGGERDFVALALALAQGREQRDGLNDFEQRFRWRRQRVIVFVASRAAAAFAHPLNKVLHIGPAFGGGLFMLSAFVQMLFVIDFFQPFLQKHQRVLRAHGVARAVF